ncbi:MAG: hypothetical protein HOO06_06840 [Bdellovibrionaceae bacterium]|nr:hypothetical protein [Pseudobdellovibrionaceae bacterium]
MNKNAGHLTLNNNMLSFRKYQRKNSLPLMLILKLIIFILLNMAFSLQSFASNQCTGLFRTSLLVKEIMESELGSDYLKKRMIKAILTETGNNQAVTVSEFSTLVLSGKFSFKRISSFGEISQDIIFDVLRKNGHPSGSQLLSNMLFDKVRLYPFATQNKKVALEKSLHQHLKKDISLAKLAFELQLKSNYLNSLLNNLPTKGAQLLVKVLEFNNVFVWNQNNLNSLSYTLLNSKLGTEQSRYLLVLGLREHLEYLKVEENITLNDFSDLIQNNRLEIENIYSLGHGGRKLLKEILQKNQVESQVKYVEPSLLGYISEVPASQKLKTSLKNVLLGALIDRGFTGQISLKEFSQLIVKERKLSRFEQLMNSVGLGEKGREIIYSLFKEHGLIDKPKVKANSLLYALYSSPNVSQSLKTLIKNNFMRILSIGSENSHLKMEELTLRDISVFIQTGKVRLDELGDKQKIVIQDLLRSQQSSSTMQPLEESSILYQISIFPYAQSIVKKRARNLISGLILEYSKNEDLSLKEFSNLLETMKPGIDRQPYFGPTAINMIKSILQMANLPLGKRFKSDEIRVINPHSLSHRVLSYPFARESITTRIHEALIDKLEDIERITVSDFSTLVQRQNNEAQFFRDQFDLSSEEAQILKNILLF